MQATVTFNGNTYTEQDINNVVMVNHVCNCGNHMHVPQGAIAVGIVEDCAHCGKDYPEENHCQMLTESWCGLIEDGDINLDE